MISCVLRGQLGNQMFQVAATIAQAMRNGAQFAFPSRSGKRGQFPFMFPKLPINDRDPSEFQDKYTELRFGQYDPIPSSQDQLLRGYFQSEKYFLGLTTDIVQHFDLPVFRTRHDVVSLHVRRGDSLRHVHKLPQPTDRYLNEAIKYFKSYKILVFSDDLVWCRQRFVGDQFEFYDRYEDPKLVMMEMASCDGHIIVNSTFSWWAARLGELQNSLSTVIAPHPDSWFTPAYSDRLSAKDIVPDRWRQLRY